MAQLFVISAPSGTGKTSLIHKVLEEELASKTKLGVSCTTRERRKNEEEGVAYFFLDEVTSVSYTHLTLPTKA